MKASTKGYLVISIVAVHFLFSFLGTAPSYIVSDSLREVSTVYTTPFFKQNWTLFAPEVPTINYNLIIEGDNGEEYDLTHQFQKSYKYNLFHPSQKLALGSYNWFIYLHNEVAAGKWGYYAKHTDQFVLGLSESLSEGSKVQKYRILADGKLIFKREIQEQE